MSNSWNQAPPAQEKRGNAGWWALAILVLFVVGAFLPEEPEECEVAYRNDYVFYGEPGSMSLQDYCENFNDTSWLDEDAFNIGETYE